MSVKRPLESNMKGCWRDPKRLRSHIFNLKKELQNKLDELEKEHNLLAEKQTAAIDEHEQIDALLGRDEDKTAQEVKQLMAEAKLLMSDELKKIVIRAYFDNSFVYMGCCATKNPPTPQTGAIPISRTELRESINKVLVLMGFEGMGKLDPLWQDWFLEKYLGLPKTERSKGKRLLVVSLVSNDNVIRTLEVLLEKFKK